MPVISKSQLFLFFLSMWVSAIAPIYGDVFAVLPHSDVYFLTTLPPLTVKMRTFYSHGYWFSHIILFITYLQSIEETITACPDNIKYVAFIRPDGICWKRVPSKQPKEPKGWTANIPVRSILWWFGPDHDCSELFCEHKMDLLNIKHVVITSWLICE